MQFTDFIERQSLQDFAFAEFIAKSSKRRNFRKSLQNFRNFRKLFLFVSQFKKKNGMNSLRSHHAWFTRATSDKRTESRTNPRYSFGLQTVNLLGPEPRAALDHVTSLYTALGDTVKKVVEFTTESITSVKSCEKHSNSEQNSVKATDIRTNATDMETRKNIV